MKNILVLLFCFHAFVVDAQNLKIIKITDGNEQPIPFVKVLLAGTNVMLSDSAGVVVLRENLSQEVLIGFSHSLFHSKYVAASDLKDSVMLMKKNYELEKRSEKDMVLNFFSKVEDHSLPLRAAFEMDYTFKHNFIVVFNENEMKYKYYPQQGRSQYSRDVFSLTHQHFQHIKADSFNPNGASRPGHALVGGATDFLFFLIAK